MDENNIKEVQERLDDIIIEYLDLEEDDYLSVLFLGGGCYAYATVLKNILHRGHIVHDKVQGHCALEVAGDYYDINGKIKINEYNFKPMSQADHLYCSAEYGFEDSDPEEMHTFVTNVTEEYLKMSLDN